MVSYLINGDVDRSDIEQWYSLTPAELRVLTNLKRFVTMTRNHGAKASKVFMACDLNTGRNFSLVNTSVPKIEWELLPYSFQRIDL